MKAMILAAGSGTRLRPLTERLPKCMVPVGGKPILEHTVVWLAKHGVAEIIVNLCHQHRAVTDYFGDGRPWGVRLTYSLEEEPLGTAGGVRKAALFFDGSFIVWYGDNLSRCDLGRLQRFHRRRGGVATIALYHREDVSHSGIVEMDADDRIRRLLEKPQPEEVFSNWVNAGIYVLEPAVLDYIPSNGTPDFARDVFPALLAAGQTMHGYRLAADEGLWWIDRHEDLARVQKEWEAFL